MDLIMMANHKDNKTLFENELVTINKGQFVTSIRMLCIKWDWSNTKVKNFLKMLNNDGMITHKSDTKKTVITVVEYSTYHDDTVAETSQKRYESITETFQKHTNKNVKNVKNDKNNNKRHKFEICDMRLAKLFFNKILENNPDHKKPNLEMWANDIRLIRERDKRNEEQIEYLINWVQQHDFWQANVLSPAKLRQKFDQLVMQVKRDRETKSNVTPIEDARKDKYKYNLGF